MNKCFLNRGIWLILLLVIAKAAFSQDAIQQYNGQVDILSSKPDHIQFNPNLDIFPGESIDFQITGKIDLNHEHFEVRRCNWFGLNCWYEPRSVPHITDATAFTIIVVLIAPDGSEVLPRLSVKGGDTATVAYPNSQTAGFTTPLRVHAFIDQPRVERTPCVGRPRYCSSGQLEFRVLNSSVKTRKDLLSQQLVQLGGKLIAVDATLVTSDVFIDPVLIDSASKREAVQGIFATEVIKWKFNGAQEARTVVDIAKFAVGLHENKRQKTDLNNKMLEAYVAQGDYTKIVSDGGKNLSDARDTFEHEKKNARFDETDSGLTAGLALAKMLRLNAIGWMEQKARYSSSDIRVAIGFMEQGIEVLTPFIKRVDVWGASGREEFAKQLYPAFADLHVDSARMLTVLRTPAELQHAELLLKKAIHCKRIAVDKIYRTAKSVSACETGIS